MLDQTKSLSALTLVVRLNVKRIGETGFSLFSGKYTEMQANAEFLKIGSFSIYPPQFYLQRGDTLNLMIFYTPEEIGEHIENLIVETSMQTQMVYQLKGTGCTLDLEAISLDSMALNFKENPLSTIHFKVTEPRATTSKKLKIKNNCAMRVQYHWSLYKNKLIDKISLTGEMTHYTIEPLQGVFEPFEEQEFVLTFKPLHAESYFEYADLIVDDIPIQAIPNTSEELKSLLASGAIGPSYLGSNTRYPSFPYLKFTLEGYGASCEILPSPSVLIFPGHNLIRKKTAATLKLINKSGADIRIKITLKVKTSDKFMVDLRSRKLGYGNESYEGVISGEKEDIEIEVESEEIGKQSAYFIGEAEDGNVFSFEVIASFTGSRVQIREGILDFGLVEVQERYELTLNLDNKTEVENEILIKTSKNNHITFETLSELIPNEEAMYKVLIDPYYKKLAPLESISVKVTLETSDPRTIEDYLIIETKYENPQYIKLYAEVQKPYLYLTQTVVDLGVTYAGLSYKLNDKAIILKNEGNLDANFEVIFHNHKIVGKQSNSR